MTQKELTDQLDYMTNELTANSLSNQRCDFTGWNLTEAKVQIAFELKRMNDISESK